MTSLKDMRKTDDLQGKHIWLMSFSYQSDPVEDVSVNEAARKRFARAGDENFALGTSIFFASSAAVFLAIIELSRRYAPLFDTKGGVGLYYATYAAAFLPTGVILLLSFVLFLLMRSRRRRRIRTRHVSRGWRDIEIYEDGIKIAETYSERWLEWTAVRNVSHTKKEILLDLDVTAFHIPARAFEDEMDFLVKAKEIRKLWHEWLLRAAGENDPAAQHVDGELSGTERL